MNEQTDIQDKHIQQLATAFNYPPTPNVAGKVREQIDAASGNAYSRPNGLVWAILLVVILAVGLLMVPQVRAAALRFFNIGAITIFETDDVEETAVLTASKPSSPALIEQLGIANEISMNTAKSQASPSLYLPTRLSDPDQLYLYESEMGWPPTLISVWQSEPPTTDIALYQIEAAQFAYKGTTFLEETVVNGQRAMWIEGTHPFRLQNNQWAEWQFVAGNVLIWWHEDSLTFRLEGADSLAEAIRIAESLEKVEE